MEIKINVTSSEEDRKNVELFEFGELVLYLSMKADGRSYFPNCSYNDEKFNKLEGRYQKEVVKHGA